MNFGPTAGTLLRFAGAGATDVLRLPLPRDGRGRTVVDVQGLEPMADGEAHHHFTKFVDEHGVRLRRVLTARYGVETGGDVYADALTWAWQHWDRLEPMDNPVGYLYRVAQSSARPHRRWLQRNAFPARMPERWHVDEDSALFQSLGSLSEAQRVSVLMVHGYNWSYAEVADVLDCSVASVTNHVHRGLNALRKQLKEEV
jgi:RNA polymerase sigma factor (sigma-70 family)